MWGGPLVEKSLENGRGERERGGGRGRGGGRREEKSRGGGMWRKGIWDKMVTGAAPHHYRTHLVTAHLPTDTIT